MLVYFIVWTFEQWRPRQYFLTEFCLVSRLTIAQHRDQHRNNTRNNKKKLHKSFETQNWQETTTQRKNKKTQTTRTGIDAISIAPMQRNVKGGGGDNRRSPFPTKPPRCHTGVSICLPRAATCYGCPCENKRPMRAEQQRH